MPYKVVRRCVKCNDELTHGQAYWTNGVCPHCGNVTRGTIVGYRKEPEYYELNSYMKWFRKLWFGKGKK